MTIQVKATEQYFPVMLYKVALTFESTFEILRSDIQMKAKEMPALTYD